MAYRDRADAGRVLAAELGHLAGAPGLLVLGLQRGGVPVAYEVARALDAAAAPQVVDVERQRCHLGDPRRQLQHERVDDEGEQPEGQDVEREREELCVSDQVTVLGRFSDLLEHL